MKEKLLEILKREYPEIDFNVDADLVDDGILDSLGIVDIISDISMEFGVVLPYEEIIPENFNSVDAMADMIKKYIH